MDMRQFVIVGHDAPTTGEFPLDDLPGAAGRLDLLARGVIDALLTSHAIRESVRVHLVLGDAVTVRFDGSTLRNLHPDERSTAALIRSALTEREDAVGHQPVEVAPGLSLVQFGLAETLDNLAAAGPVVALDPEGTPAARAAVPTDPVFVLSDHRTLTASEADLLDDHGARRISLGPTALHADQAITVAQNWLDTEGFQDYGDSWT
jgi:tRNA (pseudouridine54-N1)-methyltransferase